MTDELLIAKDVEEEVVASLGVLSLHFPGGTKDNHEKLQ
jgi:hypothetical protein